MLEFLTMVEQFLESNLAWLQSELAKVKGKYLLFDCPGQVELYTHNNAMRNIVAQMVAMDIRLKLNSAIVDIIQDYSLVSFVPLFVEMIVKLLIVVWKIEAGTSAPCLPFKSLVFQFHD
ncbi:hypothetical protein DPMN_114695 [Dreissena polymorpha]|uniref:GPN-loop GTPase 2 n=1 Tax=Dreissena polymorpha TaxID=45954 RepID=A0A9D4KKE6_DREPO|nr:hypothetical protein DPMN_114695 [Dreissena polymorpha]